MERRQGAEYDFNGQLLGALLDSCAGQDADAVIVLAMMFISPGRHAGAGGDIEEICADAMARNPGLRVKISPLIGEHPLLIDILYDRLRALARISHPVFRIPPAIALMDRSKGSRLASRSVSRDPGCRKRCSSSSWMWFNGSR